eukprot:527654-Pyramimonas_sp.AAC.1
MGHWPSACASTHVLSQEHPHDDVCPDALVWPTDVMTRWCAWCSKDVRNGVLIQHWSMEGWPFACVLGRVS